MLDSASYIRPGICRRLRPVTGGGLRRTGKLLPRPGRGEGGIPAGIVVSQFINSLTVRSEDQSILTSGPGHCDPPLVARSSFPLD